MKRKFKSDERKLYIQSLGLNPDDVTIWAAKWQQLKVNAIARGAENRLSFEDYVQLAVEAGLTKPAQIGRRPELYQLGRIGDRGHYEVGNCRFITMSQNSAEKLLNGGYESSRNIGSRLANINSRSFRLKSPDGVEFVGKNLNQFCKERGLSQANLSEVCRGLKLTYKGWTGEYL